MVRSWCDSYICRAMPTHPACGLYRTTRELGGITAGRLVYFHNHGDPGPGIYLPVSWEKNRAQWSQHGHTVPDADWSASLAPLPAEGLYRVRERFFCCPDKCRAFEPETLVQLGYDGEARALLFLPEWAASGLAFPERGTRIEPENLARLAQLGVAQPQRPPAALPGGLLH